MEDDKNQMYTNCTSSIKLDGLQRGVGVDEYKQLNIYIYNVVYIYNLTSLWSDIGAWLDGVWGTAMELSL